MKKPFWKRVNRGFVVSMALLAAVLIYVLVTQLMLLPEKKAIRVLGEEMRSMMESSTKLTEEEIEALKDSGTFEKRSKELETQLESLLMKDAANPDAALQSLAGQITLQVEGMQRIDSRANPKRTENRCVVEQDTATLSLCYEYDIQGEFWDYATEKPVERTGKQRISVGLVCKKVDGEWKIFRISHFDAYTYGERGAW